MKDAEKPKETLLAELHALRQQVAELESTVTGQVPLQQELFYQKTLLESLCETAVDGILVVSDEREWLSFNRRFLEMWGIPDEIAARRSSPEALRWVRHKLVDPDQFLSGIEHLYQHKEEESHDQVELNDGRIFDRHSVPVRSAEGVHLGRVWYYRDITERKQTEKALNNQLTAMEAALEGIAILDQDGVYTYMNDAHAKIYGYDAPAELVGSTWRTLYRAEEIAQFDRQYMPILRATGRWHGEVTGKRRDGSLFDVEVVLTALQGGGLICVCRDITDRKQAERVVREFHAALEQRILERTTQLEAANLRLEQEFIEHKQAEAALKRAEQRYRDLFEDAPLMYVITRERGGIPIIADCNALFLDTLGYRRDEVLDRPLADFYTSESRASLVEEGGYRRALEGTFVAEERRLLTRDGRTIETLLHAVPEFDAEDQIWGTRAVYVDITERKQAEERLEAFFTQSLDGCFFMMLDEPVRWDDSVDKEKVLDHVFAHQRITRINGAMLAQYGGTEEQFLGLTPADFFAHDLAHGRNLWARFFDQGRLRLESDERKLDGTPMWIEGEYVCIFDEQGRIKGHFGIQREITDRKQAQKEREALIAELESKNAELERFTYTVSHDLKSPLVTIKGFIGHLNKNIADGNTDAALGDMAFIAGAADKMAHLLSDLLELSRIGRLVNPYEAVSLTELAHEALALMAGQLNETGIAVEIAPEMPVVHGDRLRLLGVFQNLLDNAVKFRGDQEQIRVEIGVRHEGGELVCFVRDNGMGIERKHQKKVFGLFERLDHQIEGTGVGLALVQRIVMAHGGRIWVESEGRGRGSTFCFTLPGKPAASQPEVAMHPVMQDVERET